MTAKRRVPVAAYPQQSILKNHHSPLKVFISILIDNFRLLNVDCRMKDSITVRIFLCASVSPRVKKENPVRRKVPGTGIEPAWAKPTGS